MDLYINTAQEPAWDPATVEIDVLPDVRLPHPVLWSIHNVFAGPESCVFDYTPDSVGSESTFHDGLRFGANDLTLQTFSFTVPDRAFDPALAEEWLRAPVRRGLPRLRVKVNFNVDGVDGHIFLPDGRHLMGLFEGSRDEAERIQLQIAEDVSLLFCDGRYAGWMLRNPIAHVISPEGRDPRPSDRINVDEDVISLFREYYGLIDEPVIDSLLDEDPVLRDALVSLVKRIGDDPVHHGPRFALRRQVVHILEHFYRWNPDTISAASPPEKSKVV